MPEQKAVIPKSLLSEKVFGRRCSDELKKSKRIKKTRANKLLDFDKIPEHLLASGRNLGYNVTPPFEPKKVSQNPTLSKNRINSDQTSKQDLKKELGFSNINHENLAKQSELLLNNINPDNIGHPSHGICNNTLNKDCDDDIGNVSMVRLGGIIKTPRDSNDLTSPLGSANENLALLMNKFLNGPWPKKDTKDTINY